MFFTLITHMSNFMSIECYVLYDVYIKLFFMHNFRLQKFAI